ncbi:tRNA uracil 4-sulfurtransferase ThiI [Methanocella arvoryzae]|uniref:Probable tRNA sulfurtransferase n=1 Tax=Methanocella arvoryzae (strain DSM 22066 / NBRC 105507 / MRE50) TaxID=351160 RepID=Q0W492_METAR|nr:tRNA uracil 4-sulfurtransferase ThiI [Methanocella arvoryzae]CAJ36801.1 putative thiamine biosynthesis protein [Methanocella arvoryzae MRE50]
MDFDTVIVRYGEIAIKSDQIRRKYEDLLIKNLKAMMGQDQVAYDRISKERGRIFVHTRDPKAPESIARVFGVVSCSPAVSARPAIGDAAAVAAAFGRELIKDHQTFAIIPRHSGGKNQPFTSQDIGRTCGDAVFEAVKDRHPKVDLKNPDHAIHVEIRDSGSYVFTEIVKGVGGMPLGSQGKMVAMVSGGIDSPVAAWLMMKRGCEIVPVFFHNAPYFDDTTMNRALDTLRELSKWCPGHGMTAYVMPHGPNLQAFQEKGNQKYTCVFCKHLMYKVARAIAEKEGAHGIVTGSSIGQVASQTSNNMLAEIYGVDFPINHPLIGMDKDEIVELSRRIGLFDLSTKKAMGCKAVPKHPSIHGHLEEVIRMEREQFDFKALVQYEMDNLQRVEISG